MENSVTKIVNPSHEEVRKFLKSAGNSLKRFRYFEKRQVEIIDSHIFTVLYRKEEEYVGYGHLDKNGETVWLGICVSENQRGMGLGKIIMKDLINYAKDKQLKLKLSVDNDNFQAICLYEKFGFSTIEERQGISFMSISFHEDHDRRL